MTRSFVKGRQSAVVFVIFLVTSFSQGIIRAVGIFEKQLRADIGLTTSELGVAAGLAIGLVFFFAPIVSLVYRLLATPRQIALIGAICTTCGTILSSLSWNPLIFCLCFALLGLGSSLVFVSSIIILKEVAEERFDLMYGIATSGYAFGTICIPIAAQYLQLIYGWRGAMLILGALSANIIPFVIAVGTAFKARAEDGERVTEAGKNNCGSKGYCANNSNSSPESIHDESNLENGKLERDQTKYTRTLCFEDETNLYNDHKLSGGAIPNGKAKRILNHVNEGRIIKSYSLGQTRTEKEGNSYNKGPYIDAWINKLSVILDNCRSLRQPCLVILIVSYFIIGIEVAGWRSIFVPRAIHRGLSLTHVNILDFTAAVANFMSRLTLGWIMRKSKNSSMVFLCLVILEGLSKLLDVFILQFPVMLVCSFLSGIALEALAFLPVILGVELLVASDNFDILFGLLELLFGAGILTGGTMAGLIADKMNFNAAYLALAIVNGVTFSLVIMFKYFEKRALKGT